MPKKGFEKGIKHKLDNQEKDLIRFAVNSEYVTKNKKLKNEDEIGIFPPVSGG